MKNYVKIEEIVADVLNDREKIFNLILEYEREKISPELIEDLKAEIKDLKDTLRENGKMYF